MSASSTTGTPSRGQFSRGDVLVSINQQPVGSPQEAAEKLREIAKSPQKNALLLLNRHGVTQYVGVKLSKDEG